MVEVKEQKYKVNFARIEQICEKKGITKKAVSIAAGKSKNLTSDSYFTACKKTNTKWTQRQLMDVNALLKTQKSWALLTLDNEEDTEEHVFVEEIKAKSAPIAETIIENETSMDDLEGEIRDRIIKGCRKKIHADLVEVAKKYGLEVADILALEMKFV